MRKIIVLVILSTLSFVSKAQFYCDFTESDSFYKQTPLLKMLGITKEVIIVKQLKNDVMEDSFKMITRYFDGNGKCKSHYVGSKWNYPSVQDSIEYNTQDRQSNIISKPSTAVEVFQDITSTTPSWDTITYATMRYKYDSLRRIKKVFYKRDGKNEILRRLVYYDEQNRVKKIDYAPESERERYDEYVYKKDKLKIYTITATNRDCNEKMEFNNEGQVIKREIYFYNRGWIKNNYGFTYNENGLVATEIKKKDGILYTIATHYYY